MSHNEAYITLKDHKENFQNNPKVRLINPAKSQIGRISKIYIDEINEMILKETELNQWKSSIEVIEWYKNLKHKNRKNFLQLDIVDFYPSISEELLDKAIDFAEKIVGVEPSIMKTIKNARKTLLFSEDAAWVKNTGLSDVTQGGLDSCQVCELVGLFILRQMKEEFPFLDFGLYRDDGLACHKRIPGPQLEKCKKDIIKLFFKNGLKITIETNMKTVDFLDITFDLNEENFKPYRKPNSEILYVDKQSNHPQTILKEIPNSVNQRLNHISSTKKEFDETKIDYENALKSSGYQKELNFENTPTQKNNKKAKTEKGKYSGITHHLVNNLNLILVDCSLSYLKNTSLLNMYCTKYLTRTL